MNFIKRFKGILIAIGLSAVVLAISFYYPDQKNISTDVQINEPTVENVLAESEEPVKDETVETVGSTKNKTKEIITPIPKPTAPLETSEPQVTVEEKNTLSCSLEVRCDTILSNSGNEAPEKIPFIPESGIILPETEIEFSEGDTVFDVLERELKKRQIHFEFSKAAMYDSAYIEGIGNLYEFDVGDLSGWLYRVNGKVPSVGCSQYILKNGDKIEFLYTCNMGRDL